MEPDLVHRHDKRPAHGATHKGGVSSWPKVEREIRGLLGEAPQRVLTTMFDYHGFPRNAPGMADRPNASPEHRVQHVERALREHFDHRRFWPHLILHEAESWVFAAWQQLGDLYGADVARALQDQVAAAGGPERINDGVDTVPSKRLVKQLPGYDKVIDGPLAIADLGLPKLRERYPHLDSWLRQFEA